MPSTDANIDNNDNFALINQSESVGLARKQQTDLITLFKMKNKYIDLIDQTFEFPQDEFMVEDGELHFHDINMMDIINQYGTPLKITYLPKISS